MNLQEIVEAFIESINCHDVDAMMGMMTPDHTLIDPHSQQVKGLEPLRKAWTTYFGWFPDYRIEIERFFFRRSFRRSIRLRHGFISRTEGPLLENCRRLGRHCG
jgi:hypothetical protein